MSTVTGVAGSAINAVCAVSNNGVQIANGESAATAQSIVNDLATIKSGAHHFGGNKIFDNDVIVAGSLGVSTNLAVAGDETVKGTFTSPVAGADPAGIVKIQGRAAPHGTRVSVATGANKKVGVRTGTGIDYVGRRFEMATEPAAARVITLDHTHSVPFEGETMEVVYFKATPTIGATNSVFDFVREDASVVASFFTTTDTHVVTAQHMTAEFEFVGGAWRLGMNSGRARDGASASNPQNCQEFGVIPGPSA